MNGEAAVAATGNPMLLMSCPESEYLYLESGANTAANVTVVEEKSGENSFNNDINVDDSGNIEVFAAGAIISGTEEDGINLEIKFNDKTNTDNKN